jgi:CRISPR type III-A-associated RAMP protein Csm4
MPARSLLIRLHPAGPWRIGPDSGVRDRVDRIYHSDALYSAVTSALLRLGLLEPWLDATARASEPAVRFASCFPFAGDLLLVTPPRNLWPPPPSSKVRWKGARFVPWSVVETLAAGGALSEDQWAIDPASECLLPERTPALSGPFRVAVRSSAAVDRAGGGVAPHSTACLEFTPGAGLWTLAQFSSSEAFERWREPVAAAFRLLADSGFGGERSRGWGRCGALELEDRAPGPLAAEPGAYWLLSLFHPAPSDSIDWRRGDYVVTTRGGRVESAAAWGAPKKPTRMVAEGSVLVAAAEPRGMAADVAPDGFAHPVYRAGFAVAVPVPLAPETRPAP